MAGTGTRAGAASKLSLPLMILAFVAVIGFMYWLNITAQPTEVAVAEEGLEDDETAVTVSLGDFQMNPESYEGQSIRLNGVQVSSRLGGQAFWTTLPNEQPYLIHFGTDLVTEEFSVTQGDVVNLMGTVMMMSPEVLDAWQAGGAFTNDVQRIEAEFATSFVEASSVDIRLAPGGGS